MRNILIGLGILILLGATHFYQPVAHDGTMSGDGTEESPLTTDTTTRISTKYDAFSDTYTPSIIATDNLDAVPTIYNAQYIKVGNVVTVSGEFAADPTTASTTTTITLSTPIASNFGNDYEICGTAFSSGYEGASISGTGSDDEFIINWYSVSTAEKKWYYHYTYKIIP